MKVYLIPYCVPDSAGWWCGVDVCNYSNKQVTAEITVYNSNGTVATTFDLLLGANMSHTIVPDELSRNLTDANGRAKIEIIGDDSLEITPLQGCGGEGFGVLPVKEFDTKKP